MLFGPWPRRAGLLLLLSSTVAPNAGCALHWPPLATTPPRTLPPSQLVRLWRHGRSITLAAVQLARDSLSGRPWRQDAACSSCRLQYAWSDIDSVRTGRTDLTSVGTVAAIGGAMVLVGIAFRAWWPDE